jgi:hypothetical protein
MLDFMTTLLNVDTKSVAGLVLENKDLGSIWEAAVA